MNWAFSCVLPLVSDFSNVNDCMVVAVGEWVRGTSVLRASLEGAEPTEDNWGSSGGKNNTKALNKGKCRNSQHSKLIDTLTHKCYECLLLHSNSCSKSVGLRLGCTLKLPGELFKNMSIKKNNSTVGETWQTPPKLVVKVSINSDKSWC